MGRAGGNTKTQAARREAKAKLVYGVPGAAKCSIEE